MSELANKQAMRIACIIPTYNGRDDFLRLLDSLSKQTAAFDLFVVDSSSTDGTRELAEQRGVNVCSIPSAQFNHGGTRQMMVDTNPDYDIYVFMTQDAYLENANAIDHLVAPFKDTAVGAVCGRQLHHLDASPLAQHARAFNYPDSSIIKTLEDIPGMGIKAAFMSNSFAAYRGEALKQVGGFPGHVIFAEDMYVAAKMLLANWTVVYAGNAACRHSHNYTIGEEFRRYFDMGVFHAREPWIRSEFGGAGGEGLRYVRSELKFLGVSRIYYWPSAIVRNAFKLLAYKLGQREQHIPVKLKKRLGMYRRYWDGPFASAK
jgi:rhamnosyltransferase